VSGLRKMQFVIEGSRSRGRPKRTFNEVVERAMNSFKITKEDVLVCSTTEKTNLGY